MQIINLIALWYLFISFVSIVVISWQFVSEVIMDSAFAVIAFVAIIAYSDIVYEATKFLIRLFL